MSFGSLVFFLSFYFVEATSYQHHAIIIASENPFHEPCKVVKASLWIVKVLHLCNPRSNSSGVRYSWWFMRFVFISWHNPFFFPFTRPREYSTDVDQIYPRWHFFAHQTFICKKPVIDIVSEFIWFHEVLLLLLLATCLACSFIRLPRCCPCIT